MAQKSGARLGRWIRASRHSLRWSQAELGKILGVSQAKISLWERDKSAPSEEEGEWLDGVFSEEMERLGISQPDISEEHSKQPTAAAVEYSLHDKKTQQRRFHDHRQH